MGWRDGIMILKNFGTLKHPNGHVFRILRSTISGAYFWINLITTLLASVIVMQYAIGVVSRRGGVNVIFGSVEKFNQT